MSSRSFGRPPKRLVRIKSSSAGTSTAIPTATSESSPTRPDVLERHPNAVDRGHGAGDQHVDPLVVLEDVAAPSASLVRSPSGEKPLGLDRGVEGRDVVDVEPEVVVGGEHGDSERHEGAAADQQRARPARRDRPEELGLVEF